MKLKGLIAIALLALANIASAGPIYTYSGVCDVNCGSIGLSSGANVGGYIEAADGAGNTIGASELIDWAFTFGNQTINMGNSSVTGVITDFSGDGSFDLGTLRFRRPGTNDLFTFEGLNRWAVQRPGGGPFNDAGGSGSYAAAIPEPNTLTLLGLGLLAFGFSIRKKR